MSDRFLDIPQTKCWESLQEAQDRSDPCFWNWWKKESRVDAKSAKAAAS